MVIHMRNIITNNLERFRISYDIAMAMLALVIIASLFYQGRSDLTEDQLYVIRQIDLAIWLIFVADYVIRFILAKNKVLFLRTNIIDLVSIIPLDMSFQALRLARAINVIRALKIFYLFRVFIYLNRIYKRISAVLTTNNFHHVLWLTVSTIFCGAIAISYIEDMQFGDALWWSFVTTTTVGYGDIAPSSLWGRMVAVFLMIMF